MNKKDIIKTYLAMIGIIALIGISSILIVFNFSSTAMFSTSNPEIFYPLETFQNKTSRILSNFFLPLYILLILSITALMTFFVWNDLTNSNKPSFLNIFFIYNVSKNSKMRPIKNYTLLCKNAIFLMFTLSTTFIIVDVLNIFVPTPTPNFVSICNDEITYEHNIIGSLSSSEHSCKTNSPYDFNTAKKGRISYNASLISILIIYYILHYNKFNKIENNCRLLRKEKKNKLINKDKENPEKLSDEDKTEVNTGMISNKNKKSWNQYNIEYNSSLFLRPFINLLIVTLPMIIILTEIAMYKYSFISEIMGMFIGSLFGITMLKGLKLNEEFDEDVKN